MISIVKVKENLTGQKFGRLTVLYQTEDYVKPDGHHYAKWHCVCDCDEHNEIDVTGNNLKQGITTSCGCLSSKLTIGIRNKKFNEYKIENNIVYIKLSNCDEYTFVNLCKWNTISLIKELCWYKSNNGYACSKIPKQYRRVFNKNIIGLHQLICPCEDGYEPDHLDRNPLNNLTENLAPKTHQENMQNISLRKDNTSGYTGVSWNKQKHKWDSYINVNAKQIRLGSFKDIQDAINARKKAKDIYFKRKEDN